MKQTYLLVSILIIYLLTILTNQQDAKHNDTNYLRFLRDQTDLRPLDEILKDLEQMKCVSPDRYIQDNCTCIDGYYSENLTQQCQICPYPCLSCENGSTFCQTCQNKYYVSLQHFFPEDILDQFNDYLINELYILDETKRPKSFNFLRNHGKSTYYDQKTNWNPKNGYYENRKLRHSDYYHVNNIQKLDELIKKFDLFEYYGMMFSIVNQPADKGTEHQDHDYDDLYSEFIWITGDTAKQFYTIDPQTKQKYYVKSPMIHFDDQIWHGISPSDRLQWSFRIDGKFKPWVRQYILDNMSQISEERRLLFEQQQYDMKRCFENEKCSQN